MAARVIDYDDIDSWCPWLDEIMRAIGPANLADTVRNAQPKYTDDAARVVMNAFGRENLITKLTEALAPFYVRVFHATRVSPVDAASIRAEGLKPLVISDRRAGLLHLLQKHPRWTEVSARFDEVLLAHGKGQKAGVREDDRVHVCFSREALIQGCDYKRYGAEVDVHITHDLFGDDSANALFVEHRRAMLVSWVVPYADAEAAASPHGHPYDWIPALQDILVRGWAFRLVKPDFSIRNQSDDIAGYFHGAVGADRLESIDDITD